MCNTHVLGVADGLPSNSESVIFGGGGSKGKKGGKSAIFSYTCLSVLGDKKNIPVKHQPHRTDATVTTCVVPHPTPPTAPGPPLGLLAVSTVDKPEKQSVS